MPLTEIPARRFEHPAILNSIEENSNEQKPKKRISIMMRSQRDQAIVEFPLDNKSTSLKKKAGTAHQK